MVTIEIELSDSLAQAASEAGLLTSQAFERILAEALKRREIGQRLLRVAEEIQAAGIEPMSMGEIDAEVKAVRTER